MRLSDLPPGVSVNDPHINPPAPKKRNKVNPYVMAVRRLRRLERKLEAKEQTLLPLKRKITGQRVVVVERMAKLTGGELAKAKKLLAKEDEG